jgi:Flp pilus assembly protein TadD
MMQFRQQGLALGLAGLLLGQAGCVAPMASVTSTSLPSTPTLAPANGDLSRDKTIETCLTFAQSLDKNGSDEAAMEQYEKVLRLSPDHPIATRRLAVLYDRRCDFTKAEAAYSKLAKAHPRDADLMCDWGYSYFLRNDWKEAEAKLRRALEIDKRHVRARCNLGLAFGRQDRYAEAFQAFRDAGLDEADAHCNLAFVYWTKSRFDEAERECMIARQKNPSCSKAIDLLFQLEEAKKPRTPSVATKSSTGERPATPTSSTQSPGLSMPNQAIATYQLPPGWAPKALPPPRDNTLSAKTTPIQAATPTPVVPAPAAAPADSGVQGTVTFD